MSIRMDTGHRTAEDEQVYTMRHAEQVYTLGHAEQVYTMRDAEQVCTMRHAEQVYTMGYAEHVYTMGCAEQVQYCISCILQTILYQPPEQVLYTLHCTPTR